MEGTPLKSYETKFDIVMHPYVYIKHQPLSRYDFVQIRRLNQHLHAKT